MRATDNSNISLPEDGRTITSLTDYLANNAVFNVKDFGAKGDGGYDDTDAIQAAITSAIASRGEVLFPQGDYLITATITIPAGIALVGEGAPAAVVDGVNQPSVRLLHNFDDDFFVCEGSAGSSNGTGYLFEGLVFTQMFGAAGTTVGTAIKCTGTTLTQRVNWIRCIRCNFENKTGTEANWERCIDIDGTAVGVTEDGIRDVFINETRMNQGSAGTSCLRLASVYNAFISGLICNNGTAKVEITGTADSPSSNINFTNSTIGVVALDYAQFVTFTGGAISGVTGTTNTGPGNDFKPGRIVDFVPVTGSAPSGNVHVFCWNDNDQAYVCYENFRVPNGKSFQSRSLGGGGIALITVDGADHVGIDPGSVGLSLGVAPQAPGGGTTATLSTIGGSGPTVAAQNGWIKLYDPLGNPYWIPAWR